MKDKRISGLIVILALIVLLPPQARAQSSGAPDHDAFVRASAPGTNFDQLGLSAAASTSTCHTTDTIYLQWDLAAIPAGQSVGAAALTLQTAYASQAEATRLQLYQVEDDDCPQETINHDNAPALGALMQELPTPAGAGQAAIFDGPELAAFLNAQLAGDDRASFAIRLAGTCSPGLSMVLFHDRESSSGQAPQLTLSTPTAVRLGATTASANNGRLCVMPLAMLVLSLSLATLICLRNRHRHC